MNIKNVLRMMVEKRASDIHIKVGSPPILRINGELQPLPMPKLDSDTVRKVAYYFLQTEERKKKFEQDKEMDLSHSEPGVARFRVNIFKARSSYGMVVRIVPVEIPSFTDLNLPDVLKDVALEPRGLEEPRFWIEPNVLVDQARFFHCLSTSEKFLAPTIRYFRFFFATALATTSRPRTAADP